MRIQIIEDIETGNLYRFSTGTSCYKYYDNSETTYGNESVSVKKITPATVYSPNFKTDFMIKSVLYKGGLITVGQKCNNIGTIIDIEKRNSDIVFIGTRASGSVDFLNIESTGFGKKGAFNFEICD